MQTILDGLEAKRRELLALSERDLVRLSLAIAEKVVKTEISSGERIAIENVKHAAQLAVDRSKLQVRVHPDDRERVSDFLPQLDSIVGEIGSVDLQSDESVSPGGCVVVTQSGKVDADIRTQLEEIERGLLGDRGEKEE